MSNLETIVFHAFTGDSSMYDAETGDSCESSGWCARVDGPITLAVLADAIALSEEPDVNSEALTAYVCDGGLILSEDTQGFKYVACFETLEELNAAWSQIESAYGPVDESDDWLHEPTITNDEGEPL